MPPPTCVLVAAGPRTSAESTLRFLLSARSAFVDGQVVAGRHRRRSPPTDWDRTPLAGQGRRGHRRGARHRRRDRRRPRPRRRHASSPSTCPAAGEALADGRQRGRRDRAAARHHRRRRRPRGSRDHARARHGRLDVVVHNAGITRDKLLANMDAERWDSVLAVNLESQLRINDAAARRAAAWRTPAGSSACPRPAASPATAARPTTRPARPA